MKPPPALAKVSTIIQELLLLTLPPALSTSLLLCTGQDCTSHPSHMGLKRALLILQGSHSAEETLLVPEGKNVTKSLQQKSQWRKAADLHNPNEQPFELPAKCSCCQHGHSLWCHAARVQGLQTALGAWP